MKNQSPAVHVTPTGTVQAIAQPADEPKSTHARKVGGEALGSLLVPQAIDGIEVGREARRIIAEKQSYADGDRKSDRHPQVR